jgi:hypothetical protein
MISCWGGFSYGAGSKKEVNEGNFACFRLNNEAAGELKVSWLFC